MSENEDKDDLRRWLVVASGDCSSQVATNASSQNLLQYRQGVVHSVAGSKLASMDIGKLDIILKKFVDTTGGVQDAVLVSSEAELINNPIQAWDEESAVGMAVAMFFLNDKTRKHLCWPVLEQMWLQAEDSYFIGVRCNSEILLLVKANNAGPLGGLRMEIKETVKNIQDALGAEESSNREPDKGAASAKPNSKATPETDSEITYREPSRKADPETDDEITYRGRKSSPS